MTSTDLAPKAEFIPPTEPDLATLAEQINTEHDALQEMVLSGAQRAIALGKLLLKAKALVYKTYGHGHWEDWVANKTRLSERVSQRCMALANGEGLLIAKAPNLALLTATDAMQILAELKLPEAKLTSLVGSSSGRGSRGPRQDPVAAALKSKTPLFVLKRAWDAATETERGLFLKGIENDPPDPMKGGQQQ
jgi:hypothetical protein